MIKPRGQRVSRHRGRIWVKPWSQQIGSNGEDRMRSIGSEPNPDRGDGRGTVWTIDPGFRIKGSGNFYFIFLFCQLFEKFF